MADADSGRYAPDVPFPAYAFVPGQQPHPVTDPEGHSFGLPEPVVPLPDPATFWTLEPFCFAVDLFNHGYYWEAHEAWESLWKACGRRGSLADFFKGLIKLAAAGVKAREGNPTGVRRHAADAANLFRELSQSESKVLGEPGQRAAVELQQFAEELIAAPPSDPTPSIAGRQTLPVQLRIENWA